MNFLKSVLLSIILILAPIKGILICCLALILFDLITGVAAAYTRKDPITSAGFRRTISKLLVYNTLIVLAHFTQVYLIGDVLELEKIVTSFVGLTEIKSILENLNTISGGGLLASLINRLGSDNQ